MEKLIYVFDAPIAVELDFCTIYATIDTEKSNINGNTDEIYNILHREPEGNAWKWQEQIDVHTGQIKDWPYASPVELKFVVTNGIISNLQGNNVRGLNAKPIRRSVQWQHVPKMFQPALTTDPNCISISIDKDGFIQNWDFDVKLYMDECERKTNFKD